MWLMNRVPVAFFFAFMAVALILSSPPSAANMHGNRISGKIVLHGTDFDTDLYQKYYSDYLKNREFFNSYVGQFHEINCIDYRELRESLDSTPVVREIAVNLTKGLESELEIAYKLHEFVYLGIIYEETGSGLDPERTLTSRKGDCSAKSMLLASMLESRGIKSYVADGSAHRYVFAEINGSWMPLDATRSFYFASRTMLNKSSPSRQYFAGSNPHQFLFNRTSTLFNNDWC